VNATAFDTIRVSREGAVERLTLNRPDVRNAFNERMISELTAWAAATASDPGVRAVIIAGEGKVFSAGADLEWMARAATFTRAENERDATAAAAMFAAIDTLPMPVIGRIHGAALGGGSGLAAVCDVVVAARDSVFGFTEVKLGILPATIAPFVLSKIGRSAARELFLTGMRFDAARAREIGLVHAIAPAAEIDVVVGRYVGEVLAAGPEAIAAAKGLIRQVWHRSATEAQSLTAAALADRRASPEGQEGIRAFLEKRKPSWSVVSRATETRSHGDNQGHQ
jgi:methylglutaconyl-CoA hydratase